MPELVPIRHGRMLVSPFTFFRGAALPMAADLAGTPTSGLRVQLCGDAHLSNFGVFASPERQLVFDLNDFDETLPGPFEWDVKRLAASLEVAGRDNGYSDEGATHHRRSPASGRYRTAMREFARMPMLDVWYAHLDLDEALPRFASRWPSGAARSPRRRSPRPAPATACRRSTSSPRVVDGQRRIIATRP